MNSKEDIENKLLVNLPYVTPVVGLKIKPFFRLHRYVGGKFSEAFEDDITFHWFRQTQTFCSVHRTEIATIRCIECARLKLPDMVSYHCSMKCLSDSWNIHLGRHLQATVTVSGKSNDDCQALRWLRTCDSWPISDKNAWIMVASSEAYVPTVDDCDHNLKLESKVVYSLGHPFSSRNVIITDPVIIAPPPQPRRMIQIGPLKMSRNFKVSAQSSDDATFSVLSYNILSDLVCDKRIYNHCPAWALEWEYRRKNLLQEIIGYDPDILCLQEVQSDHFVDFFKPELAKRGYAVFYKEKRNKVFTRGQEMIDGCATFFRSDKFNASLIYELEFDKEAADMLHMLKPDKQAYGRTRLTKDNIALVTKFELKNRKIPHPFQSICVANTHITSSSNLPDVKLFQVVHLIDRLKISAGAPILICGDMNSSPGSLNPSQKADPCGICSLLNLQHPIHLASAYSSLLQSETVEEGQKQKMNVETKEPLFTRFIPDSSKTLDYIFYSENCLEVEGLLELLDAKSMGGAGLPSKLWSSDHIALMANFRINPPSS